MSQQDRNAELVSLLETDFVGRNEPNYAWKSACAAFQALPGLRGFWPMSSTDENGAAMDLSGQSTPRILTHAGGALYTYANLEPILFFDGVTGYLARATESGLDILGTEAYNAAAVRGLTIGGWFLPIALRTQGFMTKESAGNAAQASYALYNTNPTILTFRVSTGAAFLEVNQAGLSTTAWQFCVGRYDPSTEIKSWINETTAINAVGIPAALVNSASAFEIGSFSGGVLPFSGYASMCFLSSMMLSDSIISALFQQTRSMYNV